MGAVLFLQDISISIPIYAATGIPGAGYAIIGITFVLVAIVGALVVPRFGSFTIMAFIYSVIAIPTPVYGPPGLFKVLMSVMVGLIGDLLICVFRFKRPGYYLAGAVCNMVSVLLYVQMAFLLGLPEAGDYANTLWTLVVIYGVEGLIGTWLGHIVFDKIKKRRIVQQISG